MDRHLPYEEFVHYLEDGLVPVVVPVGENEIDLATYWLDMDLIQWVADEHAIDEAQIGRIVPIVLILQARKDLWEHRRQRGQ